MNYKIPRIFLILLLAASSASVWAEDAVWSGAGETTRAFLSKADGLIAERKYLAAYDFLDSLSVSDDYVLAKKIDTCLRYYVTTSLHKSFGLADLGGDQTLDALRKNPGAFTPVPLDPQAAVTEYLKTRPESGILDYSLGNYYYEVLMNYSGSWIKGDAEIIDDMRNYYKKGFALGVSDAPSLKRYADLELQAGNYDSAIGYYEKSIEADSMVADAYYNLGIALLNVGRPAEAREKIDVAIALYEGNQAFMIDGMLLAADACLAANDTDTALLYIQAALKVGARDYRIPLKLNSIYLARKNAAEAAKYADLLFAMDPRNPDYAQMVMQNYINALNLPELKGFFERGLIKYAGEPGAFGNLQFYYAQLLSQTGDTAGAKKALDAAEKALALVYQPSHKAFKAIADLRKKLP
jgi:tetratricopeptide (TPR) repeat protein